MATPLTGEANDVRMQTHGAGFADRGSAFSGSNQPETPGGNIVTAYARSITMSIMLTENQYGKSRVRLVKVERHGARHNLIDLNVDVQLTGEFAASYVDGDNRNVVPTDTMKNTVYALARRQPLGQIEEFAQRLCEHFLSRYEQVSAALIAISQVSWQRFHDHAFLHGGEARRTAVVRQDRASMSIRSGIDNLIVLKTTGSAFSGFVHDEYTTLKETRDRIFGTAVKADWSANDDSYAVNGRAVRETILQVFAERASEGVQHTLYAMGEAVLDRVAAISEIHLAMPNRHCLLVDLSPFGMDNPNEVFLPIDEPHGLIEGTLRRR
jgi:urate oxidase